MAEAAIDRHNMMTNIRIPVSVGDLRQLAAEPDIGELAQIPGVANQCGKSVSAIGSEAVASERSPDCIGLIRHKVVAGDECVAPTLINEWYTSPAGELEVR